MKKHTGRTMAAMLSIWVIMIAAVDRAEARISREQALGQAMSDFQKRDYKNAVGWFSKTIWYCIDEKAKDGRPMEQKDYVMGATAYLYRGLSYVELKQREKAKVDFERAEQISEGISRVRVEIANGYIRVGAYGDAVRILLGVLAKDPEDGQAHFYLARAYYKKRDYADAWEHLKKARARGVPSDSLLALLRKAAPELE